MEEVGLLVIINNLHCDVYHQLVHDVTSNNGVFNYLSFLRMALLHLPLLRWLLHFCHSFSRDANNLPRTHWPHPSRRASAPTPGAASGSGPSMSGASASPAPPATRSAAATSAALDADRRRGKARSRSEQGQLHGRARPRAESRPGRSGSHARPGQGQVAPSIN